MQASFTNLPVALICVVALTACTRGQPEPGATEPQLPVFSGQAYHVAPTGAGAHPGTSPETPLLSLQEALKLMKPGDGCILHGGTYRDVLTPPVDGTPEAPIHFVAMPGEDVVFSGLDPVGPFEKVDARTWRTTVDWDLGSGNTLRDSQIAHSAGNGVNLYGNGIYFAYVDDVGLIPVWDHEGANSPSNQ